MKTYKALIDVMDVEAGSLLPENHPLIQYAKKQGYLDEFFDEFDET